MGSLADVNFALLQRNQQRQLIESNRVATQQTQKRSSKMGLGRLIGTVAGGLLGVALAPVTGGTSLLWTAALAGMGSRIGSEWGQQTTNITETDPNKQKLYRDTAADLRSEQFEAQRDLNRMANVRALTDAFSVYTMGSTAGGQAVMKGAQTAGIQGAWQGGKEYAKSKITSLLGTKNELLQGTGLPAPTEIAKIEGALPWQDELMQTPTALTPAGVLSQSKNMSMADIKARLPKGVGADIGGTALAAGVLPSATALPPGGVNPLTKFMGPTSTITSPTQFHEQSGPFKQLLGAQSGAQVPYSPLTPAASTGVGINPNQLPTDMLMRNAPMQGSGATTVDQIFNQGRGVSAATPSRSTMLQSAVSQSLPTAQKFSGTQAQNKVLATAMGLDPNKSLIEQMKKRGIDASMGNRQGMWNQYLSGNIMSSTGAFQNMMPQYGPPVPQGG